MTYAYTWLKPGEKEGRPHQTNIVYTSIGTLTHTHTAYCKVLTPFFPGIAARIKKKKNNMSKVIEAKCTPGTVVPTYLAVGGGGGGDMSVVKQKPSRRYF